MKIFVNGCFDVLHRGHVELFKHAKGSGTFLTVGIDTDRRVKELKGDSRPINSQEDRKFMLESIKYIDQVVIFDSEEELEDLILHLSPHAMIVGEEYKNKRVVGHHPGIELKFFKKINGYSTTNTLQHFARR
tara:strand:+ start:123 stop:518 length:396 start_codon:yes stop_codon:yes gene_type:complete